MPESAGGTAIRPLTAEIPRSTFATPIMRGSRPQMLTGFADSPISLAAFMLVHDARGPELISEVAR